MVPKQIFSYGFSVKLCVGFISQLLRERSDGKFQYMCLQLELCSLPAGASMGLPSRGSRFFPACLEAALETHGNSRDYCNTIVFIILAALHGPHGIQIDWRCRESGRSVSTVTPAEAHTGRPRNANQNKRGMRFCFLYLRTTSLVINIVNRWLLVAEIW